MSSGSAMLRAPPITPQKSEVKSSDDTCHPISSGSPEDTHESMPVISPGSIPIITYSLLDVTLFCPSFRGCPTRRKRKGQQGVVIHHVLHGRDSLGNLVVRNL